MGKQFRGVVACFSLGSNLGNRTLNLNTAIGLMSERMGRVEKVSRVYESPSWGYSSGHHYYNCCTILRTEHRPIALLDIALELEEEIGRNRKAGGYEDRIIDIDFLLYEGMVIDHPRLKLPHPKMIERRFVLLPMAEIAPRWIHPLSGRNMVELLKECPDPSEVSPV
jgi:deoxyguanosine kinase